MALFSASASAGERDEKRRVRSSRAFHLAQLNDLMHLSIQRNDMKRARHAWSLLIRCKEFDWKSQWKLGLAVVADPGPEGEPTRMDYLQKVFLACPDEKEAILKEIVMSYIAQGREQAAMDQLELYLHSFPFQDNPVLHMYAGMLCLYVSQSVPDSMPTNNQSLLRAARSHFLTTLSIDPGNEIAKTYRQMVRGRSDRASKPSFLGKEHSDDEPPEP